MYLILIYTIILVLVLSIIYIRLHPATVYYAINPILQLESVCREPLIYNYQDLLPASLLLEQSWYQIYQEGLNLLTKINDFNYLQDLSLDLGKENCSNWTTIPLRLFNRNNEQLLALCPTLSSIISEDSTIVSCMFSLMKPGKVIEPHYCPYDGLLRYQLALDIPWDDECYLHVDNIKYHWIAGQGIVFDQTFLHGAVNNTDSHRLVLLVDISRPYSNFILTSLHQLTLKIMQNVPSTIKSTSLKVRDSDYTSPVASETVDIPNQ